ncbi:hypothetical protein ACE6H2_019047 [Prunus campanulata]
MMMNELKKSYVIRLNIGGNEFCTSVDTLTQREPNSMLAAMFSGRHQDPAKGYVFIDRDGTHFRHILNWLRDGIVPSLEDCSKYSELLREAEYFQLLGLREGIHDFLNKKKEDDKKSIAKLDAELTRRDIIRCIQSNARIRFRGVNLSGLDLSKLDLSNIDFSYACLRNVCFSSCDLDGAKFNHVDAEGAIFRNASLQNSKLIGANLRDALFVDANLRSAKVQGACLINCSFWRASLNCAELHDVDLTNANLQDACLRSANLKNLKKTTNTNFMDANLEEAYIENVSSQHLEGAKLVGTSVNGQTCPSPNYACESPKWEC